VHDKRYRVGILDAFSHRLCQSRTRCLCLGIALSHFMMRSKLKALNLQVSAYPAPKVMIHLADAAAIKVRSNLFYHVVDALDNGSQEITTYRARFPKPIYRYKVLAVFGANIVASEGEEWKKYRKIAAPAFSEVCPEWHSLPNSEYHWQRNNRLVWDETVQIMTDMFDNVWGDKSEIAVDHCVDITLPVRLPWLRFYISPNIFTRLPSSSSASQVTFTLIQPYWPYDSRY
jgi:hypothetical protein